MLIGTFCSLEARGRGEGERGGGAGGNIQRSGGSKNINRSPSLSRSADKQPKREQPARDRNQISKPQGQPNRNQPNRDQVYQRIRNEQSNRQNRPQVNNSEQLKNQINTYRNSSEWKNRSNDFKNRYPNYNNWFNNDFYKRHGYNKNYNNNWNPWRQARWSYLNGYLGYGWAYPYYYGDGGYYPYTDYTPSYETTTTYYAPSYNEGEDEEWMPLGVFLLTPSLSMMASSNAVVQLAVNKKGEMDGTFYFPSTDRTYDVAGAINPQTQEVSIQLSDDPNSPLMTTGLYNLTLRETPLEMDFPNGVQQTWVLVRLIDQ